MHWDWLKWFLFLKEVESLDTVEPIPTSDLSWGVTKCMHRTAPYRTR